METSDRIKLAAVRLFARLGVEAVTVRDIVAAAELKNPGSLNYYFRSKEELIRQVIVDAMGQANEIWGMRLKAIEDRGGPTALREVVEALVTWPLSEPLDGSVSHTARFLAMAVQTRSQMVRSLTREMQYKEYDRAILYIRRFLKDLPDDVIAQRVIFFFWSLTGFLTAYEAYVDSEANSESVWHKVDPFGNFVDSMVGMLTAPVSTLISTPAKAKRQPSTKSKNVERPRGNLKRASDV
ncbi:TetR family transcriptional regulator [Paraburkholderia sp. RAU2J]|uniref:TetR/AcrR family transcriptional regulator n=1 Tax=Paraburkholderia sp. RAU2J TaxID=1938810 RepID=UPI000F2021CC|nr:TetR/AcrR family transcriptional regulator [Paraburkholderia sp. RAU2J]RKT20335.1 TetR family transcriptional regulator [Paraburkholderia sp. RAU2J]